MTGDTAHDGPSRRGRSHEERGSVRIIGADRAGGDQPSRGGTPAPSQTGSGGTVGRGAQGDAEPAVAGEPGPEAEADFGPEDWAEVAGPGETALPHWTEAPTGKIPAVLSRRESGEDDDPWIALPEPSWREGHADWAREEPIAPALREEMGEGRGLLGNVDDSDRQPWSFELEGQAAPVSEQGDGTGGAFDEERAFEEWYEAGTETHRRTSSRNRPRRARHRDALDDLDAGDLFGAAPGPLGAAEPFTPAAFDAAAFDPGPGDASRARGADAQVVGHDTPDGIAGEKTSVLRLSEIAAAAVGDADEGDDEERGRRAERRDHATADDATADDSTADDATADDATADDGAPGESGRPFGRRGRRLGGRVPGARRESARHAQLPEEPVLAQEPLPRIPPAAPAGVRGAAAASAIRRGDDLVSKRTGRNITAAVLSGIAIGAVALVAFSFGTVPSMVVVTVILTLAAAEAFGAFRRAGYRPATLLGLVAVAGLLVATYNKTTEALPAVLVLLVAGTVFWHLIGVDRRAEPVRSISATLLVFCWVGVFGSFAALLLAPSLFPHRTGIAYLLGALVAAVAYDVGALAAGAWVGRHPLSAVSPGKTWEGLIGGAVIAVAVSAAIVRMIHPWTLTEAAVLGVIVAVVSPLGDLCESLVKRHLGLKDMGRLLPGHGGLLDRIDGLLFVLPATYYLVRAFH